MKDGQFANLLCVFFLNKGRILDITEVAVDTDPSVVKSKDCIPYLFVKETNNDSIQISIALRLNWIKLWKHAYQQ